MSKKPSLYPNEPLQELYINPIMIFTACIIFAIVFWTIGIVFRYYIVIGV